MKAEYIKSFFILFISIFIIESCSAPFLNSSRMINSNNKLLTHLKIDDPKDTFYFYLNPKKFTEKNYFRNVKKFKTNPIASEIIINNSDRIEIIYLYTKTKALDNFISNDEIMPLLFINNRYIGNGWPLRDSIEQVSKK